MTDEAPKTYGDASAVLQEYFTDLTVRIEALQNFALAMILENALQGQEIDLLKAELEDKFTL